MKRIISLVLSLVLVFTVLSFTACAKAPAELVSEALMKTERLNSYEALVETSVKMNVGEASIEVPTTVEIKVEGANTEAQKVLARYTARMPGVTVSYDVYVEGDYAYVIRGDKSFKLNLENTDNDLGYDFSEFVDELMEELPAELYANAEIKKEDDGAKTVSISVPDSVFNESFEDLFEFLGERAMQSSLTSIVVSDGKVSVSAKDGYVSRYSLEYTMTMNVLGTSVSASATASVRFINPGKPVTVSAPEGYLEFEAIN